MNQKDSRWDDGRGEDESRGGDLGASERVPTLKNLILESLGNPRTLQDRLKIHYALNNIGESMLDEGDDTLSRLKERSKKGLQERFPAVLKYYEGDHEILRAILGAETFDSLSASVRESEEAKSTLAKYRRGSIVEKDSSSSALTPEEERIFEERQELPLRVLLEGVKWPQGVEPSRRERYLSEVEFVSVFGITKESFGALPQYDRKNAKIKHKLF